MEHTGVQLPGRVQTLFHLIYTKMTIISNYDSLTGISIRLDFNIKSHLFIVTKYDHRLPEVKKRLFTNQRDAEAQLDEWVKE